MYLRLEREEVDEERRTLEDDREGGEGECSRLCPRSRGACSTLTVVGLEESDPKLLKGGASFISRLEAVQTMGWLWWWRSRTRLQAVCSLPGRCGCEQNDQRSRGTEIMFSTDPAGEDIAQARACEGSTRLSDAGANRRPRGLKGHQAPRTWTIAASPFRVHINLAQGLLMYWNSIVPVP